MAMKKAVFFTIDSILASGIIIIVVLLAANFYSVEQQKVNVNYASQDLVKVFSAIKVGEVDNDYVKSLILSGDITNANNTILEQIGNFWADGKLNLSYNFTKNLTDQIVPSNYGFSVLVNGEEIFSRDIPLKRSLVSSRKIITGIAKAKPTEGFTSRVLLNGIKSKKTNAYIYFGGYEGDGNLTKKLILPIDVISINSSYLEVDTGGNFDLYINGLFSGSYAKGSSGGGAPMVADKWNISNAYLSNFRPGNNTITLNFTSGNSYIAGGFLKVVYVTSSLNDTKTLGYEKEWLPGIDGLINLYSSFYAPSGLSNLNILLHYLSNYQIYLTIGNTTIFESNVPPGEQVIELNNSNISALLDYGLLNDKTIPFRVGLRDISYIAQGSKADAVLTTDRTSSMSACDVNIDCSLGIDCNGGAAGCQDRRDNVALKSNNKFVDTVLNISGNNVGLVGFGQSLYPSCDFHDLSSDNVSLKYRISNYSNAFCGSTCISCGILEATELLTEKTSLYGLSEISFVNSTQYRVGDAPNPVSVSEKFPISVDSSKLIKSRLAIFGSSVNVNSGYQQCVYFNNKYIGRMCDSATSWHTCSFPIKPEWFTNTKNNVTITGGTTSGCTATSGTNDNWDFKDVSLSVWQSQSSTPNVTYDIATSSVTVGDSPFPNIASINLTANISGQKLKAASLEFEVIDVSPSSFDCVFVNGNYIGRVDYQKFNGTNVWQKVLFDVPAVWIQNGKNNINITGGTTSGCKRTSGTNDQWSFRNLNLSIVLSDDGSEYDRFKSLLVMSDGSANTKIGDCAGCDSSGADAETIQKACEAHDLYGIGIYAVVFGNPGSVSINTLNQTACCDDCSHFYTASDADSLLNVYTKIANAILNVSYQSQSLNLSGSKFNKTTLFPDSFIELNYSIPETQFNKVPLGFETDRFGNNVSTGTLTIYPNTTALDAKVTSYSSDKWTDNLVVNGNTVYRLSDYGPKYISFGDPFVVSIPTSIINQGDNSILISTGVNSTNNTGGSMDDRVIYTLLINGFADYTSVLAKSNGCAWTVSFEDGTASTIKVPPNYNGADSCSFAGKSYDVNDALDNAVYKLFSNLDIDKDGKLEVNIDENNLNVNTLTVSKVPSLWGPAIIEIRVWE